MYVMSVHGPYWCKGKCQWESQTPGGDQFVNSIKTWQSAEMQRDLQRVARAKFYKNRPLHYVRNKKWLCQERSGCGPSSSRKRKPIHRFFSAMSKRFSDITLMYILFKIRKCQVWFQCHEAPSQYVSSPVIQNRRRLGSHLERVVAGGCNATVPEHSGTKRSISWQSSVDFGIGKLPVRSKQLNIEKKKPWTHSAWSCDPLLSRDRITGPVCLFLLWLKGKGAASLIKSVYICKCSKK